MTQIPEKEKVYLLKEEVVEKIRSMSDLKQIFKTIVSQPCIEVRLKDRKTNKKKAT